MSSGSQDSRWIQRWCRRHSTSLILVSGVLIRAYLLFFTSAHFILRDRPELSTPQTSFRRLREGVYTHRHEGYMSGTYHSHIYLRLFSSLLPEFSPTITSIVWTTADVITSVALLAVSSRHRTDKEEANIILSSYLLNPYAVASCVAKSTTTIDNTWTALAISLAANGYGIASALVLAIAVHTDPYNIVLLVPLVQLGGPLSPHRIGNSQAPKSSLLFALSVAAAYAAISWLIDESLPAPIQNLLLRVPDLTPNSGMWWYFFTEMFDHFRDFFLGVFQLHVFAYTVPLILRFDGDPLASILVSVGVVTAWKSYPTLGELGLSMGLLSCFPAVVSQLRHPLFTASVYLYTAILLPLLHALWLVQGTGNANFFYAATMVHGLNTSLGIVDVVGANLRASFRTQFPEFSTTSRTAIEPDGSKRRKPANTKEKYVVQFTSSDL